MWKGNPDRRPLEFLNWKVLGLLGGVGAVGIGALIILFTLGWNYGRMKEDEAVQLYEKRLPAMVNRSVPVRGGMERTRLTPPDRLRNPLPPTDIVLEQGKKTYQYFCRMCHGPGGRGKGTVGQSFAPLPTDLGSRLVQDQSDGQIFHRISAGYKRHPPLAYTVSEKDRWAVIRYIRNLPGKE